MPEDGGGGRPAPARAPAAPAVRATPGTLAALAALTAFAAARPAAAGDAARGAEIAASRSDGLCVLCHAMPGVPASQAGTLGPDLAGVGARLTRAELRERLVAPERVNPVTVMPSATRTDGLQRVAGARRGWPLLDERQLDDVLAWLETLR